MVAPGRNFVVSPLFGPITSDDKKKVIAVKVMGFFSPEICEFQNQKKSLPLNWLVFSSKIKTEKQSSPQISGDMVSLHNMVSPQNGDTRGKPTLFLRHLCCTTGTYINTVPLISTRLSKTKHCFAEGRDSRGKLQRLPLLCSFTSHCEAFFTLERTKKL